MHRLRLFKMILGHICCPRKAEDPTAVFNISFRVLPPEVEVFRVYSHCYNSFTSLARWNLCLKLLNLKKAMKLKWAPLVMGEVIRFRRSLKMFQKVTVKTQLIYWNGKDMYFQQQLVSKGEVYATCYVRGVIRSPSESVSPEDLFEKLPPPPETVPKIVGVWEDLDGIVKSAPKMAD